MTTCPVFKRSVLGQKHPVRVNTFKGDTKGDTELNCEPYVSGTGFKALILDPSRVRSIFMKALL